MGVIVNNTIRNQQENDYTDDVLYIVPCPSFVTLSNMTTEEAIVIKNGMLRRIMEKYGDTFTTASVVCIRNSADVVKEQQIKVQEAKDFGFYTALSIGIALVLVMFLKNIGLID